MKTIYKYPLQVTDYQEVQIPWDAQLLSVQVQNGTPCLWALVETTRQKERVVIDIYGTGNPIEADLHERDFIDTFQMHGGSLVFHAFRRV